MHPSFRKYRTVAATLIAAATLSGCAGHGNYTTEHKNNAENRLAEIKAATNYDMAHQRYVAGDLQKALDAIEDSIAYKEDVAKSHVLQGRVLFEMGRDEAAIQSFARATELDPTNAEAQYYSGMVMERFSQPENAFAYYSRAMELNATDPQYTLASAEMLIELNRLDEAEQLLVGGASNFRHNAGMHQTLGHVAQMRGDNDRAIEEFRQACLLAPDDTALIEDLARAQINAGQYADGEYNLRRILKTPAGKDRRDLTQLQAKCLVQLDRPVEARSILLQLVKDEQGVNDFQTWSELGNVSIILKDETRLRDAASRLVAIAPNRVEGYLLMAMYQRAKGQPEQALLTVDQAIAKAGRNAEAYMLKAIICDELGRPEDARIASAAARQIRAGHTSTVAGVNPD
ncbi:MAG: tetratricopeptide repeat protein [Phycisphaeraceae bacterium]|nr:tetratricopeptide repeat protein [Phycisphaerales bacterium]MCB9843411.1 tetratricopeptide repeat protein [Phycisphaeraceae bacterium]